MKRLLLILIIPLMLFGDWPIWGNLDIKDTLKLDGNGFLVKIGSNVAARDTLDSLVVYTNSIWYQDTYWEDLRFPASRIRQGATQKPDFDTDDLGLLFPQNDTDEIAYIIAQMPHSMKIGSDLEPHIHFYQTSVDTPVFKIDYRWYDNGGDPTGAFTTIIMDSLSFVYTSDTILQIGEFPLIEGSGISGVSSILDVKLYRDDNVVTGDVLLKEFDIHYEIDAPGSRTEFVK